MPYVFMFLYIFKFKFRIQVVKKNLQFELICIIITKKKADAQGKADERT